jgi:hypothetical protein
MLLNKKHKIQNNRTPLGCKFIITPLMAYSAITTPLGEIIAYNYLSSNL